MNRLQQILSAKRAEVERLRGRESELRLQAEAPREFRSFRRALQRRDGQLAIIAEVKKASPSAGLIASDFDPVARARDYEQHGADAISVLTDEKFFGGKLADISAVHEAVTTPVLRKDFIVDEIQITEAAGAGADAILLIVAALTSEELLRFSEMAAQHHLDVLVEVHSREEIDIALNAKAPIIGVNNRNLATFEVDLAVTETLSEFVPDDVLLVSESGFKAAGDVSRARRAGADAILVGEALMRGEITIRQLRAMN